MEADWTPLRHWSTDDALDMWLKQQGLQNSQAIINKLALGEDIVFAQGTRRLRYAEGKFYLEEYVASLALDTGKRLNLAALRQRWQGLVGREKVQVKFDKTLRVAVNIRTTDTGYVIRLNPDKLRTLKQVAAHIAEVENELAK